MATVTASNSVSTVISGDQTVAVSVNHNNSGRFTFVPSNSGSIIGDAGTSRSFGPLPTSAVYGPFGVAGTLTILCDVGTVTYTVNDTYFPNEVGIQTTTPGAPLQIGDGANVALGSTVPFAWIAARANSSNGNATTPQELLRLSWQEGSQDLGAGEGCAINFAVSLVGDAGTYYPVAQIAAAKNSGSDTVRASNLIFSVSPDGTTAPAEILRVSATGNIVCGTAAVATTATDGFLYIPSCAGAPTGVPSTYTGQLPIVYDSTNNKLYLYNGSWKGVTLA